MEEPSASDAALIRACQDRNRAALETVFRVHLPALERFVARLVGSRTDVEDIVQDTLVTAIAAFPRFRGESAVGTWLDGIAVNVVRRYLRQPRVRGRVPLHLVAAEECPTDATVPPDSVADGRQRLQRIYTHLSAIGAERRIAFILHVVEGRSIAEVAQMVGASCMATKSRIFWARRTLLARARRDPALRDSMHADGQS